MPQRIRCFLGWEDGFGGVNGPMRRVSAVAGRQSGLFSRVGGCEASRFGRTGTGGCRRSGPLPVHTGFNFNLRRAIIHRLCVTTADQT